MSKRIEDMSDEELMALSNPAAAGVVMTSTEAPKETDPEPEPKEEETPIEETPEEQNTPESDPEASPEASPKAEEDKTDDEVLAQDGPTPPDDSKNVSSKTEGQKAAPQTEEGKKPTSVEEKPKEEEKPAVNYEEFYKQIIGVPFKANGKPMVVQNPEEAIRLIQMGAGYGRKLNELQPAIKIHRMLEKANLLDESEISYLIDIKNKNPEAIKKLIKESGIDPLDLNTNDNIDYKPTNHSVSDKELMFQEALSAVKSAEGGLETLQEINQNWDETSKSILWESPELLGVIQSQRELKLYDAITAEIDRQKLLGNIPNNTPFLHAYKKAGDILAETGRLPGQATQTTQTPVEPVQPTVVATRPAAPKVDQKVANSSKASAAAPTRTVPRVAATVKNPLELSDDEFMKLAEGRR